MAGTVSAYQVGTYTTPVEGGSLDASVVTGNDNTTGTKHNSHDADATIHVQSSALASRPSAGTAQRFWVTTDGLRAYLDSGSVWGELAYLTSGAAATLTTTTTPQLTIAYDGSNNVTISVASNGATTLNATGAGAAFTFSDAVTHSSTTILSGALTYGGVTLSNAVTGTGNMVLSASPTLTGTLTCATVAASGNISTTNGTLSVDLDTATQGATVAVTTQSITIPSGLFSTRAVGTQQAIAHQMAAGSESARLFLVTAANSQTISGPRVIFVGHEGTFASPAATANGSVLGSIEFEGYTNAYTISGARIFATTTQLWTATAMGTKLSFDVVANGTTSNTTALTLGQDSSATFAGAVSGITTLVASSTGKFGTTVGVGNATPSASGAGITFPATQSASTDANTLDDYEEGAWTPADGSGATLSFSAVDATYEKIGRTVIARFDLTYPVTADGSAALISGLPFTVANEGGNRQAFVSYTDETTLQQLLPTANATTVAPLTNAGAAITNATLSGNRIIGCCIYHV